MPAWRLTCVSIGQFRAKIGGVRQCHVFDRIIGVAPVCASIGSKHLLELPLRHLVHADPASIASSVKPRRAVCLQALHPYQYHSSVIRVQIGWRVEDKLDPICCAVASQIGGDDFELLIGRVSSRRSIESERKQEVGARKIRRQDPIRP